MEVTQFRRDPDVEVAQGAILLCRHEFQDHHEPLSHRFDGDPVEQVGAVLDHSTHPRRHAGGVLGEVERQIELRRRRQRRRDAFTLVCSRVSVGW